mmetsp:Transcript_26988/g.85762  ORF Transcript_26988/g.85762 Transcript_26988/m.85762 type:complete len:149 (-) Transcript_26988:140-586(-)
MCAAAMRAAVLLLLASGAVAFRDVARDSVATMAVGDEASSFNSTNGWPDLGINIKNIQCKASCVAAGGGVAVACAAGAITAGAVAPACAVAIAGAFTTCAGCPETFCYAIIHQWGIVGSAAMMGACHQAKNGNHAFKNLKEACDFCEF